MSSVKKKKVKEVCPKCSGSGTVWSKYSPHKIPCDCPAGKEADDAGGFEDPGEQPRDYGDL